MLTPQTLYQSEEYVRNWHNPKASRWCSQQIDAEPMVMTTQPWPMLFALLRLIFSMGLQSNASSTAINQDHAPTGESIEALLERGTSTTLAVLQAVAEGEVNPRVALHTLRATMSTLALFEAVAWGEISPYAAASLLGGRT